mgnify:CR=1 FL=1|jgi:hypothetical protein
MRANSLYNSRIDAAAQELQNTNALKLYLFALVSKKQSLCDLIFPMETKAACR